MRTSLLLGVVLVSLFSFRTSAQTKRVNETRGRNYGRSMVVSGLGIVATSQTLASAAGADILRDGGSAVDAAIAANAVLGVTEPMMNGIGGDLFAIVYEAGSKKLYGLNSSGWAPQGLTIEFLKSRGITKSLPGGSIQSTTVPGAVAGWDALHQRFGKLPLARVLAPAIYYAKEGVPIAEMVSRVWAAAGRQLENQPGFRQVFLPGGHAPRTGEIFRDADLAQSLELIALHGRDGFYRGPLAQKLLRFSREQGGTMSEQDLADFQPEWVTPISTAYRGWTVSELPPNGQGIAALSMLNIMEQFPLPEYGHNSVKALHIMIEAKKLAYADLMEYTGDPRFSRIPVDQLLSKDLARRRADSIDPSHAHCTVLPSDFTAKLNAMGSETTYLTAIDQNGNIVSLIQSNFASFGTGLVAPGTGFALQNRGELFTLEPGKPNSLAPHKRPLHTIIPGFMQKGEEVIGFGIMGGFNQAQAHAQFVSNIADFGMNIQAALSAPRFTKPTFAGCDLIIESRIPEAVRDQLAGMGHQLDLVPEYSPEMGRGNAVMTDVRGVKYGASDPRGDGEAIPQTPRAYAQ
ncbi:MAG: gamma-glutamyltransferase [Acidobacteriaceae bacterium]|nr:gamma-glutamyltransferase [Acidobacteriaceae bacterium]MBV9781711.1 gamma-glutamyltransferase [Acidobacteriaceae bacterium]